MIMALIPEAPGKLDLEPIRETDEEENSKIDPGLF